MSLQTGSKLAQTASALIDPENLKIVAYELDGPLLTDHPSFLRLADVREFGPIGMIVDSSDEFIGLDDVIKIRDLYKLHFRLTDMPVIDQRGHKLGKVEDYVVDNSSFYIKQLSLRRGIMKSLGEAGLLIDRGQIVEINDQHIVVRSTEKTEPMREADKQEFVNPFRAPTTQPDNSDIL